MFQDIYGTFMFKIIIMFYAYVFSILSSGYVESGCRCVSVL